VLVREFYVLFAIESKLPELIIVLMVVYTKDDGQNLSLIKVASLIEAAAKKGVETLDLQGRLVEQLEWLPDSIEKLSSLVALSNSICPITLL